MTLPSATTPPAETKSIVPPAVSAEQWDLAQRIHRSMLPDDFRDERVEGEMDNRPTAYVCENFVCQLPTNDPAKLAQLLGEKGPPASSPTAHSSGH